ncbi:MULTISPECIES: ornithine cyclodeaminase family protein [unclassified Psychrobacter]|uniref:ornithine cyclodeaminase family protein n=1 Tax=unclassified Psychrobacter TaxID=196806 RepID=UPI0018F41CEC|nr:MULTISPECIES: ornithine cyclodeaminase family protein [unclassified Psychrobacter]
MQWLNQAVVTEHLTMPAAIEAIERLLKQQVEHPDWVKSPERLVIPTFSADDTHSSGSHLSMPATLYDGDNEYAVVKLVTICPDNPSRNLPTTTAIITVSNNDTGEVLAVMDGVCITQVRTAALSGVATKYLAKTDAKSVAVVGCGGMAYEQLNAVLTVRPDIDTVYVWNRSAEGATRFQAQFAKDYPQWNVSMQICEQIEDAIQEADIINVATRATEGLFDAESIKSDVHINAVGAYQPSMKEISNEVIAQSNVIVDDREGSRHEAGDLIQADAAEDCPWIWSDIVGDLQGLVTGAIAPAQTNMTLFKSVGAARFDAAVALDVAQMALKNNIGTRVQ